MAKRLDMIKVMTDEFVYGKNVGLEYTMKGDCERCGRKSVKLTKHSKVGHHKPPFILLCRICHDKVHGLKYNSRHRKPRSLKTN